MADGLPGRPKKYANGMFRLEGRVPVELAAKFEDFCRQFDISKTDALSIAMSYCVMSEAEREARLREVAFENEMLRKENAQKDEELSTLRAQLASLKAKQFITAVRSAKADELLRTTRDMLARGQLSQKGLAFRCDEMLRPFLKEKIPEEQKQEIAAFINQAVAGHQGGSA